ncbi:EG45-like domain containing protein [Eucalyptus grandis]|nr:EG45-like domain containing protein [Eucalyptus grandis]
MEGEIKGLFLLVFCSIPQATLADSGTATCYTEYVPSACYGYDNPGGMIAAASDELWEGGAACGRTSLVTCTGATNLGDPHPCTGASVVVTIVDYCPSGCRGTIDLSQEAFAAIAHLEAGKALVKLISEYLITPTRRPLVGNYDGLRMA